MLKRQKIVLLLGATACVAAITVFALKKAHFVDPAPAIATVNEYFSASGTEFDMPAPTRASLNCAYRLLRSNAQFKSIAAYSVDHFRVALEYTVRSGDGHSLTSDILISGPLDGVSTWEQVPQHGETTEHGFEELDVLTKSLPSWDSNCNLRPVFDNTLPGPKPRSEWRSIKMED